MLKLMLATTNPAKVTRLRWLLEGLPVETVLAETPPPVEESADTFVGNAELKARAWSTHSGLPALASDGGISVPALGGRWDPTHTRRASGPADPAEHLLQLMANLEGDQRRASMTEAAALALPDGSLLGAWESQGSPYEIAHTFDPRGVPRGFWLPGLLLFGPERRRYAELTPAERERLEDHWAGLRAPVRAAVAGLLGQAHP